MTHCFKLEHYKNLKPFYEEIASNASMFDYENFGNSTLKKVFKDLADKGWAALPDDKYAEVSSIHPFVHSTISCFSTY